MIQFASPFKMKAQGVRTAYLESAGRSMKLAVQQNVDGTATLSTAESMPAQVWTLRVDAACGCFSQLVYTVCPPPHSGSASPGATGSGGKHDGTGGVPTPIPTCP